MTLTDWHSFQDGIRWRLTPSGVEVDGFGIERSRGAPETARRIWDAFHREINEAAKTHRVPAELIVATVATESSGKVDAVRLEPGYVSDESTPDKVSVGLTQTLIATAREAVGMSFGRDWLLVPSNAIRAGTAYIARQGRTTSLDPPLVAAAYNAGRLRYQDGARNRWKLRQFPIGTSDHVDRFVRFFNDTVAVFTAASPRPAVSLADLVGGGTARSPAAASQPTPSNGGAEPSIRWGAGARPQTVPRNALEVILDVLRAAGIKQALVTSTQRTPKEQAAAMFANCERLGAASQYDLYGHYGDKVVDVYVAEKRRGSDAALTVAHMAETIVDLGPANVSRHCADPRRWVVVDIAPSSLTDCAGFERAVKAEPRVKTFLLPPKDPAYHLEISPGD